MCVLRPSCDLTVGFDWVSSHRSLSITGDKFLAYSETGSDSKDKKMNKSDAWTKEPNPMFE